jgi:carbamoyl-phosphate synthase small subunit
LLPLLSGPAIPAILALADGSVFQGFSIGAAGNTTGEVVFNTAMTGYQEILTDPSYCQQLVTLTYPHIGNYGINAEDVESEKVYAAGLIIKDLPLLASNFRMSMTLSEYLVKEGAVAIANIDTRQLTRHLRSKGAQNGCIMAGRCDAAQALERARAFPGLKGMDLAKVVSVTEPYAWTEGSWALGHGFVTPSAAPEFKVVAYDYGVKRNILRMLVDRGCALTVVPAQTSAEEVMAMAPDGVFLSNGPGDPEPCDYAIRAIRTLVDSGLPVFGICLGHQMMALAVGARTTKMHQGHHGANHPVMDYTTNKVEIVSMNHGFAVDAQSLPANATETHRSLFDGSNCGIALTDRPAFSVQHHPEAAPGPQDSHYLFKRFVALMEQHKAA